MKFLYIYASPYKFYGLANRLIPIFCVLAVAFLAAGLYVGFFLAPTDFQQGEGYRIIFLHVPVSWISMLVYLAMGFWSAICLIFNSRMAALLAAALAPTGAVFTILSLVTGALWGQPMWGTWWVWDARLTSELILLFLYIGFMALRSAIDEPKRADQAASVLALIGTVNIPIIYFSVQWWSTLHQGASVSLMQAPAMATVMLTGMLLMVGAAWCYTLAVVLSRTKRLILERESHAAWVKKLRGNNNALV